MKHLTLDWLECPFCGGGLRLQPAPPPVVDLDEIVDGIVSCACCAYPVVDGIAYIRTGAPANAAMEHLGESRRDEALMALLELPADRRELFTATLQQNRTFRDLLGVLGGHDKEYLLYRFSDPTFGSAAAVAAVLAREAGGAENPILDFGGGPGHLSRVLARHAPQATVVLADVSYWELWLARTIVVPGAQAVCCDGNAPLPFRQRLFSLAFSADAFHYVWSRRLLAGELERATSGNGTIGLCHLHNADVFNWSAGMPLSASGYRRLFPARPVRMFAETTVTHDAGAGVVDFSMIADDARLAFEPALVLVASGDKHVFRAHAIVDPSPSFAGMPNPLYDSELEGETLVLRLSEVSAHYDEEFGELRRQLPPEVRLPPDWRDRLGSRDPELIDLVHRRVLLDLPENYL